MANGQGGGGGNGGVYAILIIIVMGLNIVARLISRFFAPKTGR